MSRFLWFSVYLVTYIVTVHSETTIFDSLFTALHGMQTGLAGLSVCLEKRKKVQ